MTEPRLGNKAEYTQARLERLMPGIDFGLVAGQPTLRGVRIKAAGCISLQVAEGLDDRELVEHVLGRLRAVALLDAPTIPF